MKSTILKIRIHPLGIPARKEKIAILEMASDKDAFF